MSRLQQTSFKRILTGLQVKLSPDLKQSPGQTRRPPHHLEHVGHERHDRVERRRPRVVGGAVDVDAFGESDARRLTLQPEMMEQFLTAGKWLKFISVTYSRTITTSLTGTYKGHLFEARLSFHSWWLTSTFWQPKGSPTFSSKCCPTVAGKPQGWPAAETETFWNLLLGRQLLNQQFLRVWK